jgi:hypothetical protein
MGKKKKNKVLDFSKYLKKKNKKKREAYYPDATNFKNWYSGKVDFLLFNYYSITDKTTLQIFRKFIEKVEANTSVTDMPLLVGLMAEGETEDGEIYIDFSVCVNGVTIDFGYSKFKDSSIVANVRTESPTDGMVEYWYKSVPDFNISEL